MLTPSYIRAEASDLLCKLSFPEDAAKVLTDALEKLLAPSVYDDFSQLLLQYDENERCNYIEMIDKMKLISEKAGIHEYTGAMLLFICMAPRLKKRYAELGIDEAIFYDSLSDLRYKLYECIDVYGVVGTFVASWYAGFFRLDRFAFGRLQFDKKPLGFECEYNGVKLSADSIGLNTHIPRTGGRLDHDEVLKSYRRAREFFGEYFEIKPAIFFCSSWLLDPWNLTVLTEKSNLYAFIKDFKIVETGEYADYKEAWRLFDMMYTGDVDALPQNSSLRRAYAERIRRGEKLGWGRGVFIME
ncbi:MAG: DUF5596 domain-containing protein [Clostridia bacterium]|nr:DUF5596 domain-containing protein [Clostridia bacterium]MBQ8850784.1 DUF5596 domain-containing protein [Clostridia bacterium]